MPSKFLLSAPRFFAFLRTLSETLNILETWLLPGSFRENPIDVISNHKSPSVCFFFLAVIRSLSLYNRNSREGVLFNDLLIFSQFVWSHSSQKSGPVHLVQNVYEQYSNFILENQNYFRWFSLLCFRNSIVVPSAIKYYELSITYLEMLLNNNRWTESKITN